MDKLSKNRIGELAKLTLKKHRQAEALVVVDGRRVLEQMASEGIMPIEIYTISGEAVPASLLGCPAFTVDEQAMRRICDSEHPQSIAGLFDLPKPREVSVHRALYLDGISDPGNMGTIFRLASAFAWDSVLLSSDCVELGSPKVIRASLGSVYTVPWQVMDYAQLKASGWLVISTDMRQGTALDAWQVPQQSGWVMVIGSEAHGVSKQVQSLTSEYIHIRMAGAMESLNASVAAGIISHHVYVSS